MVDISLHALRAHSPRSRLAAVGETIAATFSAFGAAIRVSRALEGRREPHPADLKILGIEGMLPKRW